MHSITSWSEMWPGHVFVRFTRILQIGVNVDGCVWGRWGGMVWVCACVRDCKQKPRLKNCLKSHNPCWLGTFIKCQRVNSSKLYLNSCFHNQVIVTLKMLSWWQTVGSVIWQTPLKRLTRQTRAINHPVPAVIHQHWPFFFTCLHNIPDINKKLFCVYLDLVHLCIKIESQFLNFYQQRLRNVIPWPSLSIPVHPQNQILMVDAGTRSFIEAALWFCSGTQLEAHARWSGEEYRSPGTRSRDQPMPRDVSGRWHGYQLWQLASVSFLLARDKENSGEVRKTHELFTC